MLINGFQKLTVLDYPGKVACIVFTPGCNFRCPFCHNASLVTHIDKETYMDVDEVLAYLKKRQGLLDGVVITGGEPLLQPEFVSQLFSLCKNENINTCLDTSGSILNDEVKDESQKKVNLFERLKQGLTKAKQGITDKIDV